MWHGHEMITIYCHRGLIAPQLGSLEACWLEKLYSIMDLIIVTGDSEQ